MARLASFAAENPNRVISQSCTAGTGWLNILERDVELADELMTWYNREGFEQLSGADIAAIYEEHGIHISLFTANRHRRRQCSCDFKDHETKLAAAKAQTADTTQEN